MSNKPGKEEKSDRTTICPCMDQQGRRNGLPYNNAGAESEDAAKEGETASNRENLLSLYNEETRMSYFMSEINKVMKLMGILLPTAELETLYGKYDSMKKVNKFKLTYSYTCFNHTCLKHSFRIILTLEPESKNHKFSETADLEFDILDHGKTIDRMIRPVDLDHAYAEISLPSTLVNLLATAFARDQSNASGSKQSNEAKQ